MVLSSISYNADIHTYSNLHRLASTQMSCSTASIEADNWFPSTFAVIALISSYRRTSYSHRWARNGRYKSQNLQILCTDQCLQWLQILPATMSRVFSQHSGLSSPSSNQKCHPIFKQLFEQATTLSSYYPMNIVSTSSCSRSRISCLLVIGYRFPCKLCRGYQ